MGKFVIQPHGRLQEWVAERQEGHEPEQRPGAAPVHRHPEPDRTAGVTVDDLDTDEPLPERLPAGRFHERRAGQDGHDDQGPHDMP